MHLQALRIETARNPQRKITEPDFVAFFRTIRKTQVSYELPSDAHPLVFHPNSRKLWLWDLIIRAVAVYFFWCAHIHVIFLKCCTGVYLVFCYLLALLYHGTCMHERVYAKLCEYTCQLAAANAACRVKVSSSQFVLIPAGKFLSASLSEPQRD